MREIKFRIYLTDYKYFAYFDLNGDNEDDFFSRHGIIANYGVEEWQQYTGLKDKNGVEIYEGDIVAEDRTVASDTEKPTGYIEVEKVDNFEYADGAIGTRWFGRKLFTVEWKNESCGFEPFSDSGKNCGHCGGRNYPDKTEIIGNIYENPELLPDKQEV